MFRTEEVNSFSEVYACSTHLYPRVLAEPHLYPRAGEVWTGRYQGETLSQTTRRYTTPNAGTSTRVCTRASVSPTYTLPLSAFLHLQALCAQSKLERTQVLEGSYIYAGSKQNITPLKANKCN